MNMNQMEQFSNPVSTLDKIFLRRISRLATQFADKSIFCKAPSACHSCYIYAQGSFNNYVDKMRGGGVQKMSVFVHVQGKKTVHAGRGVRKLQNSVHVVIEWPLRPKYLSHMRMVNMYYVSNFSKLGIYGKFPSSSYQNTLQYLMQQQDIVL